MKSLSELLNPNVAITKNDAYFYAQSICQKVDFSKGADDSTQKLHTEIENEVSIQDLTLPELYRLATIVKNVIEASQLQDDEFQITSWGSLIWDMIGKDLQRRIQESYNSEEKDFQKNEELLDIVSRVCLLVPRQLKMELQENYFNLLIQGYKAYVMQTYTDTTKTEKLIIIADLKSILGSDGQDFPKKMNSIEKKLMKTKISYVKIHGEPCSWALLKISAAYLLQERPLQVNFTEKNHEK